MLFILTNINIFSIFLLSACNKLGFYDKICFRKEIVMKKKYESPLAEKYEFNYLENVVASGLVTEAPGTDDIVPAVPLGTPKKGKNNPGCYHGNKNGERECAQYD